MQGSFLRFYVHEGQRHRHDVVWEWLLMQANKLGIRGGSAFGASAMGYVLEQRGLPGALSLSVAALALTALLTIPFLRRGRAPAADAAGAAG